uniref:50S ribosome-binding GTPase n=1 Tax=Pristionchus pacificus TaxID=54126 RepID=A0A2A6BWF9_PRIPA|eukprot:PDM70208.1 50S ribosome-binding GTPase [Pristionchus pacificus]
MKTISSRGQRQDDQIASIIDSLIFGHLQRKQYSKTLNALLSESPHLTKDATTAPNAPNQIILNVNCFLHDQNLEQIIHTFYNYGRFDVSPNLLDLGKKLRDLTNEFATELSFGCHSYSNNEQRLYGRKVRARPQQNKAILVDQMLFVNQQDVGMRSAYNIQRVSQSVNDASRNDDTGLQTSQAMESDGGRDENPHDNNHHNRRKAVRPLKQSQRVMQFVGDVVKMSNEMRDKEAGIDNTSFIDPFLDDNFEFLTSVAEGETLFETLESVERDEAIEADQNSRDSMNRSGGIASLSLDIPMHYDVPPSTSSLISPLTHIPPSSSSQQSHSGYTMPIPPPSHSNSSSDPTPICRLADRPLMEQYNERPCIVNAIDNLNGKVRESSWAKNVAPPSSQMKCRLPPPPLLSTSSSHLPTSTSTTMSTTPKLSSLGRIPKKGQSSNSTIPSCDSPMAAMSVPLNDPSKMSNGFRMSKGKVAPFPNGINERRDSLESQDTLRAESVGESDCTMTENEEEQPLKKETNKQEKKPTWDDLFEDSPSTVEEGNREKEHKALQENKRRLEMKELEKKRERDKRRKDKDKKEDERRDRSKEDRNRTDKRSFDDRKKESYRDEKDDREKEQRKRREQEEQKKIIEAQKRQMEADEKARQKKKEEENRKRELKEKEDEKRREKEKEMKKVEDEKLKQEKETKTKEERRNELERRRRKEALLRKNNEKHPPLLIGDSPLDKIAAVMDGKELKNEFEHRSSSLMGSLHSSKSGIFLGKAQELRGALVDKKSLSECNRPIRPNRIQMAPMKRPPSAMISDDESDDDDEDEEEQETTHKKKGLEELIREPSLYKSQWSHLDFLVVHPRIRWGPNSPSILRDAKLQLEEAITLIGTMPDYRVANSVIVGTDYNTKKARLWGEGRLHELIELKEESRATAVMVNVDRLSCMQQSELHSIFRCPIFDRFNLVLSIFSLYARDEVARLQIALAQVPYLRKRLNRLRTEDSSVLLPCWSENAVVYSEEDLRLREQWLKKRLNEAVEKVEKERNKNTMRGPSIAVVGYTNAGKTSLIKRLTGSSSLHPLNRLFATLHTSEYSARLPSGRVITLADTIGFLYDLPLDLLASFNATLAHVVHSDVILHIRDISNRDWRAQDEEVMKTLERLGLNDEGRKDRVITIDNKIDKGGSSGDDSAWRISCRNGEGMNELIEELDRMVRKKSGVKGRIISLPYSSHSIQYLYSEGFVVDEPQSTDTHLKFHVNMTDEEFEKFKSHSKDRSRTRKETKRVLIEMPILSLDVKWSLVNITDLEPVDHDNFRWHFKVKCTNCGEAKENWHYIIINEEMEVPGSRGNAHLVEKCKLCQRVNTLTIIEDSMKSYSIEKNEEFQSILQMDCRGIEPYEFDPRNDWKGIGPESNSPFDEIDLTEKEWSEYDEKIQEAVEINSFEFRFSHVHNKK